MIKLPTDHSHDEAIEEIDRSTFIGNAVQSIKADPTQRLKPAIWEKLQL